MDPLSEVLQSVRLTGAVFLEARFTAPWCVSARVGPEDCRPHLAQPVQVIAYHYVVEGGMVVSLDGGGPVEVRRGQTVLLPRNDPHVLGSAPGLPPVDADRLIQPAPRGSVARIVHGGGGARTRIVCGFLGSDQARHPLVAALPRLLTVDMAQAGSGEWIESSLRFALRRLAEGRLGAPTVMSRLSELMLVEAVRCYAATLPADRTGWLAGLRDRHIGRALALIHGRPQHPWTTASLPREVGLSR
ncbi:MAG: cupin domain-containing protein, partial [Rhodospirillaceae bacterium]|nr:cupin domain-containing protein [Rhodospirillaceae bacterium]